MTQKENKTEMRMKNPRKFEGKVVSVAEQKTIHVLVSRVKWNTKYDKQFAVSRKYAVHDEKNIAKNGDDVVFEECRPLSKTKRWKLVEIKKKNS